LFRSRFGSSTDHLTAQDERLQQNHTVSSTMVSDALAVACGAVCGALARHNIALVATQHALAPWHIAGINTAGSAVLGAVAAAPLPPAAKLCVGVGACGA
jgi:fluoride ion exporter CrcB/FEX